MFAIIDDIAVGVVTVVGLVHLHEAVAVLKEAVDGFCPAVLPFQSVAVGVVAKPLALQHRIVSFLNPFSPFKTGQAVERIVAKAFVVLAGAVAPAGDVAQVVVAQCSGSAAQREGFQPATGIPGFGVGRDVHFSREQNQLH